MDDRNSDSRNYDSNTSNKDKNLFEIANSQPRDNTMDNFNQAKNEDKISENNNEGFEMQSGVRQGCPISPLLFAASVDVLLRILVKRVQGGSIKAFADGIGAVFCDWDTSSPLVESIFKEFVEMSGLELNMSKTTWIPLWECEPATYKQTLLDGGSFWGDACIADEGAYLGFIVGPGSPNKSWNPPSKNIEIVTLIVIDLM